jgi:23S rRNA pseudouridine2605 synthase
VKLNDEVLTTPATVLKNLKGVTVDGKAVAAAEPARLFRFHKPAGLITAERDPAGRPTIYNALRNALPRDAAPDADRPARPQYRGAAAADQRRRTEARDGTAVHRRPRTYRARTFGDITQERLEALSEGVEIDGIRYGSIDANMERRTGRNQWIELTLTEGKNREVRRVLEHLGLAGIAPDPHPVRPFPLADIPRGMADEIRQVDVERFRKTLKPAGRGQA